MMEDLRLIDSLGINHRTIVTWYDKIDKSFNFGIFNLFEQPNYIAKLTQPTEYGYLTYIGTPLKEPEEASKLHQLFLNDLLADNNWWEDDSKIFISNELKQLLESKFKLDKQDKPDKVKLRLIKND